jgi:o-succinylbenzoate synthase
VRLASVEVIPYALPFRRPYVTARGRLDRREMVLLRLRDRDGAIGLGEAVPLSLRGGAAIQLVVEELETLREWTERDGLPSASETAALSAPARCAVLTALLDLRAHGGGGPIAARASSGRSSDRGTASPSPIACNATLVSGEPEAVAEDALRWAEEGFSTFKLKLGAGDDVGQVRAVREALGAAPRIRVDANGVWDVEAAVRLLGELEPFDVELAEQPVATLAEMKEVAAATSIPLAADESVESRADAELAAASGACRFTGIKLSKVGGPEEALAIADVLPAYLSSALDGPVGIAAAAQVAQTLRETGHPERLDLAHGLATQRLFAATIAAAECELRDGMLHPPPGPGLGVEIDERALRLHRL